MLNNIPPQGGFDALRGDETLPVWLQRAGYYTGLDRQVPERLRDQRRRRAARLQRVARPEDAKRLLRLRPVRGRAPGPLRRPDEDPTDPAHPETYSSDVYTDKAVDFIDRRAPLDQPFFLWVAYNAPHTGIARSAPRRGRPLPRQRQARRPRHRRVRGRAAADAAELQRGRRLRQARSRSATPAAARRLRDRARTITSTAASSRALLAVDDGVQRIVDALEATGELDSTLLVFTSDNGMMHGEHRIPFGKNLPYEESIRVPLLIRGPGMPAGVHVRDLVANVDLAPTILDAAGARARLPEDGRSLLALSRRPHSESGRELAIEGNPLPRRAHRRATSTCTGSAGPNTGRSSSTTSSATPTSSTTSTANPRRARSSGRCASACTRSSAAAARTAGSQPRLRLRAPPPAGSLPRPARPAVAGKDAKHAIEVASPPAAATSAPTAFEPAPRALRAATRSSGRWPCCSTAGCEAGDGLPALLARWRATGRAARC